MTALRDEQMRNRCKGFKVKQQSFKCGAMRSKQLSTNGSAVAELDAVAIIRAEIWYSTIKYDDSWRCRIVKETR